jgi:hypothetical protein
MRVALIALMLTIATQLGADGKSYKPKDCKDISMTIDFLLSITPEKWDDLKKQPENEKVALELSWVMDLAANYTTIYTAFCEDDQ